MNTTTYQQDFINFCLKDSVLNFGEFTLKSGRKSPYFFNTGLFKDGNSLLQLGQFYAQTIVQAQLEYDVLFGPAYKGIPLVVSTAIALARHYQINKPYCFDRKEIKDHGEGGQLVGAPLSNQRVLLIDDVISAGTAIRQSIQLLEKNQAQIVGIVILFDRQERGQQSEKSAVIEISQTYQIPVIPIANLHDIITYLQQLPDYKPLLMAIETYRRDYGV